MDLLCAKTSNFRVWFHSELDVLRLKHTEYIHHCQVSGLKCSLKLLIHNLSSIFYRKTNFNHTKAISNGLHQKLDAPLAGPEIDVKAR